MGTTQKQYVGFRPFVALGAAIAMVGGRIKGKQINTKHADFKNMVADKMYSGSNPRLMLTLPPISQPIMRSQEVKSRKRDNRRARRARINTRGYA